MKIAPEIEIEKETDIEKETAIPVSPGQAASTGIVALAGDSGEMTAVNKDKGVKDVKTKDTMGKDVDIKAIDSKPGLTCDDLIVTDVKTKATTTNSKVTLTRDDLIVTDKKFRKLALNHRMVEFFETWETDTAWETEDLKKEVFQLLLLPNYDIDCEYSMKADWTTEDCKEKMIDPRKVKLEYPDDLNPLHIESVDFVRTPVDGIKFLAENWTVNSVALEDVTGIDLNVLNSKTITNLVELIVRYAGIKKLVMMNRLVDLKHLDLSCNVITEIKSAATEPMEHLERLELRHNPVDPDHFEEDDKFDLGRFSKVKMFQLNWGCPYSWWDESDDSSDDSSDDVESDPDSDDTESSYDSNREKI